MTVHENNTIEQALSKAKIGMMQIRNTVFFSTLCLSLDTIITTDIPTAATNGYQLLINPDFFLGLNQDERIFVLAHETLHVAYLHALRGNTCDPRLYNIAADYVINLELKAHGFRLITNCLYDPQYKDMSTEEVYKLLKDNAATDPLPMPDLISSTGSGETGQGHNFASGQSTRNIPELSEAAKSAIAKIEQEVLAKVSRAAMTAELSEQAGSIPASIQRHLKDITKPKVNWKVVLQRFFTDLNACDYSWSKPNRKYLPSYLPKLVTKQLGRIDFAIDTSGSINAKQFNQFVSEVHAVLRMLQPSEIGVYQFDSKLQGSHVVKNIRDIIKLPFSGGGGTNPQPAIDEFQEHSAKALMILTDGHFYHHLVKDPKRPVVWIVYDNPNFRPPFGKAIHFSLGK